MTYRADDIARGAWWTLDPAGLAHRMKAEIEDDIADGIVPETVTGFSELHDYVDANCYGGVCDESPGRPDDEPVMDVAYALIDAAQEIVNEWLERGRKDEDAR